jgi:single-strand DNA-binding protein
MADNTVTLIGNLTREPEIRFTNNGRAITTFGLAVSRRYQVNGEWQENTSFFNVVVWGQTGENVAHSLHKGARVVVAGRLEQRSYETQDGDKRNVVEVVADEIGPSLRWATATVERTDRRTADDSGGFRGGQGGQGGGERSPAGAGAGGDEDSGEEPF